MPISTKVLTHAVSAVVINLIMWLAANQQFLIDNVPQPWGPIVATAVATFAAWWVTETNPAPSSKTVP